MNGFIPINVLKRAVIPTGTMFRRIVAYQGLPLALSDFRLRHVKRAGNRDQMNRPLIKFTVRIIS
jgi:hypothetical protein